MVNNEEMDVDLDRIQIWITKVFRYKIERVNKYLNTQNINCTDLHHQNYLPPPPRRLASSLRVPAAAAPHPHHKPLPPPPLMRAWGSLAGAWKPYL